MEKLTVVWLLMCCVGCVHPVRADYTAFEAYDNLITATVHDADLPAEYAFLPLLLTDCDTAFVSRYAAGLWALSVPVAVHYGLQVNDSIDDRCHPALATCAAVQYLSDLRRHHDGNDTLTLRQFSLCAPLLRVSVDSLMTALGTVGREYRDGERTSSFLEPLNVARQAAEQRDSLLREERRRRIETIAKQQAAAKTEASCIIYKVKSGDYLGRIAQRNHVTVRQLMTWNNLKSDRIREGQKLKIYK